MHCRGLRRGRFLKILPQEKGCQELFQIEQLSFLLSTCEGRCFRAECQSANWYRLKDRIFGDGAALSALGCLILLGRPWVNL
jgi:hypothetical protein